MKTFKPQQQPEPRGDVEVGDHLYVHHGGQPCTGRVVCHGRHGVTVEVDGQQHRVKWDKVLGHKQRVPMKFEVLEHGEDGMLVRDHRGRQRFINVPPEARDVGSLAKALTAPGVLHHTEEITMKQGEREIVLFFKALPQAGAVAAQKPERQEDDGEAKGSVGGWSERYEGAGAAQAGQHVAFRNGEHRGHGKVAAVGGHGVTVADAAGGEHRIKHEQVTHHWGGEGEPDKEPPSDADADEEVLGGYDGKVALPGELVAKLLQGADPELRKEVAGFLREKAAGDKVEADAAAAAPDVAQQPQGKPEEKK